MVVLLVVRPLVLYWSMLSGAIVRDRSQTGPSRGPTARRHGRKRCMTSRIEPDSRTMVLLSLTLVGVLAAASFTLSFLGLIQAAA